jgi:hypothetical protein
MFDPDELDGLRDAIGKRTAADAGALDELRNTVRQLRSEVRPIRPRMTTAISLVASDGGNNKMEFDPFFIQLVRVVDSYGKQLCLEAVSPSTDTDELSAAQFGADGEPRSALGHLINDLGIASRSLHDLSPMIPKGSTVRDEPGTVSPGWVSVYRDLCEWAVLYERICHRSFATDTLIVRDGLLRDKIFHGDLFIVMAERMNEAINRIYREDKRRVFLVGLAKHTKVLEKYRLAMVLEDTIPTGEPRFVAVPRKMERTAVQWAEWTRGIDELGPAGESPKFVIGNMYFVRFGAQSGDPIWTVDIFSHQVDHAQEIFGYLLADAKEGFPVPLYPWCLQKAHEYAQIAGFDFDILRDEVIAAVRRTIPVEQRPLMDALAFYTDPSGRRY